MAQSNIIQTTINPPHTVILNGQTLVNVREVLWNGYVDERRVVLCIGTANNKDTPFVWANGAAVDANMNDNDLVKSLGGNVAYLKKAASDGHNHGWVVDVRPDGTRAARRVS